MSCRNSLGVSVEFLRRFADLLAEREKAASGGLCCGGGGSAEPTTALAVCTDVVGPATRDRPDCAYIDVLSAEMPSARSRAPTGSGGSGGGDSEEGATPSEALVGQANVYVCYAWSCPFQQVLAAAVAYAERQAANGRSKTLYFYIDLFVEPQNTLLEASKHPKTADAGADGSTSSSSSSSSKDIKAVRRLVNDTGGMLAILHPAARLGLSAPPVSLGRAWCLWEMACAVMGQVPIDFVWATERLEEGFRAKLMASPQHYANDTMRTTKMEEAVASLESEQAALRKAATTIQDLDVCVQERIHGYVIDVLQSTIRDLNADLARCPSEEGENKVADLRAAVNMLIRTNMGRRRSVETLLDTLSAAENEALPIMGPAASQITRSLDEAQARASALALAEEQALGTEPSVEVNYMDDPSFGSAATGGQGRFSRNVTGESTDSVLCSTPMRTGPPTAATAAAVAAAASQQSPRAAYVAVAAAAQASSEPLEVLKATKQAQEALAAGKAGDAIAILSENLELRRQLNILDSEFAGDDFHLLGIAFAAGGHLQDAVEAHDAAVEIYKRSLGGGHDKSAASYTHAGEAYFKLGDNEHALALYTEAMDMVELRYGPLDEHTAVAMLDVARILASLGRFDEAYRNANTALNIRRRVDNPAEAAQISETASIVSTLALQARDFSAALEAANLVVTHLTDEEAEPLALARAQEQTGMALVGLQRSTKAEVALRQALASWQRGGATDEALGTVELLAKSLRAEGRHQEAIDLITGQLGDDSGDGGLSPTAGLLLELGDALVCVEEAERGLERLLQGRKKLAESTEPVDPSVTIRVYLGLGTAYNRLERFDDSRDEFTLALDLARSTFGTDHPVTAKCRELHKSALPPSRRTSAL